jgi:hypothetical protein
MHNNRATFTNRLRSQGLNIAALISFQTLLVVGVSPAVQPIYQGKMQCMRLKLAIIYAAWVVLPSLCDEFSIIPALGTI